jgi:oxalate decarboxylase
MALTKKIYLKKQKTKKIQKIQTTNNKIVTFLQSMKKKMSKTVPYLLNIFKKGSISTNAAGTRIAEMGKQINANYGQLFFYDLVDNAMRVPHWHSDGDEIGFVLAGKIRVTIIWNGKKQVFTAEKNGTWFIPRGTLHCLENVSNIETKFLVSYNNPNCADRDFLDAWKSVPTEILCASTFLSEKDAKIIAKQQIHNRLSKFEPEWADLSAANIHHSPYSNNLANTEPVFLNKSLGEIGCISPKNTIQMKMAWQKTVLKSGALRIPHWYSNSDVLLFIYKGSGFVSMMDSLGDSKSGEKIYNFIVKEGDLLALPSGFFHSILNINIGSKDLEYYEAFMSGDTNEISLLKGIQSLSNAVSIGALGISKESAERMKKSVAPEYIVKF